MLKNQTIKAFFAALMLCLLLNSCGFKSFSQPYETIIQIVDMDGKPIKGVKVNIKMFIGFGSSFTTFKDDFVSGSTTNLEGNTTFNYSLDISDSSVDGASFAAEDDTLWKVVTDVVHTVGNSKKQKTIKQVLKIQMDTLKDVKVRLTRASARAGQLRMYTQVNTGNTDPNKDISNTAYTQAYATRLYENKKVFDWSRRVVAPFDSTITAKVYSKSVCYLYADSGIDAVYPTGEPYFQRVEYKTLDFLKTSTRDGVFYFSFQ